MSFVIDLALFLSFQFLVVYSLGKITLDFLEIKLWWIPNLIFSLNIGIFFLTLIVLILGLINWFNLIIFLLFITLIWHLNKVRNLPSLVVQKIDLIDKSNFVVVAIILFYVLLQSSIVFTNGVAANDELKITGVFTEDAMWHIALINNLQKNLPPKNPLYAEQLLNNYNYFADLFIATTQRFTKIESLTLYFKLIGPFLSFLAASSLYFLLKNLTKNKLLSGIGVMLVMLTSTYYYIFGIFRPGMDINPGTFWGNDYSSKMINYQLSFSYLAMTTLMYLFLKSKNLFNLRSALVISLLIAISIGFKSYGAILILSAFCLICIYKIFKKEFRYFKIIIFSVIFSTIFFLYLRNGKSAEKIFAFDPLWMIETMFSDSLRINSSSWVLQKNFFRESGNYLGVAYLYIKGIAIFISINLGLKLFGFLAVLQNFKRREKELIFFIAIVAILGLFFPMILTQGGVKWNTIQFFHYSSFGLGILFVLFFASLKKKLKFIVPIMLFIWITLSPGVYKATNYYLSDQDNLTSYHFKGTQEIYRAANYLSSQSDGILLIDIKYFQTPFITAISAKNTYFADTSILSNLLLDWHKRNEEVEYFFSSFSTKDFRKSFLTHNNINYIFTSKDNFKREEYLNNIYTNSEITIYKLMNI